METIQNETKPAILYQDLATITPTLAAYKKAASLLFGVMQEIKAMGVTPHDKILISICTGKGELIKQELSRLLEKELNGMILPFRKQKARNEFSELLNQVDALVLKVDNDILKKDRPHTTYIDTSLLTYDFDKIVVNEQAITDASTVYNDPAKESIKQLAEALLKQIAEFNEAVATASNGKIKGLGLVNAMGLANTPGEPLVLLYSDQTSEIDGEAFRHIH